MYEVKEKYFEEFSEMINCLKKDEKKDIAIIENYFNKIKNIENLNLQDIITYMLYCFEIIELTQKWKLKKQINYELFIENLENIYDEIFCSNSSTFNNKIIASSSLGNIIEKTIIYNIETECEKVLNQYIKCVTSKKDYLTNNNLTLLRGNLYCQVYNTLKQNIEINDSYHQLLEKVNKSFDYLKYTKNAITLFNNTLDKENLSYIELNNYLTFYAYNDYNIEKNNLIRIIMILTKKFPNEYFDKNVFVHLFKELCKSYMNENNIDKKIEIIFSDYDEDDNIIYLNYNNIDCNIINNLENIKIIFSKLIKSNYKNLNLNSEYINLLEIKDKLINKKNNTDLSVINLDNYLNYISIQQLEKHLNQQSIQSFDEYIAQIVEKNKTCKQKIYFTNNEIFEKNYNQNEIKELKNEYSLLNYEYDENGKYKSISQIIEEKIIALNNLKLEKEKYVETQKFYDNLLKYRSCELFSLLNDYYSLLLIDSVDSNLIKEKEFALKEILPNLVLVSLSNYGEITEDEKQQIFNEYINPCIKKISQNRVNNKSFETTKDFLNYEKSNSDNYFGICKLQELLNSVNKND